MAIGAGWQGVVAYVNLACYYIIGVPLGVLLAYAFDLSVRVRSQMSEWRTFELYIPEH